MEVEQARNSRLRRHAERPPICTECGVEMADALHGGFATFEQHLHTRHADLVQGLETREAQKDWAQSLWEEATREAAAPVAAGASVESSSPDARQPHEPVDSPTSTGSLQRKGSTASSVSSSAPEEVGLAPGEPFELIKQPESRPISQEQLVAEVKGIYAGLVMVENKCIEVDTAQNGRRLDNKQWQALVALHRTLLHEHHDFFLASQHPSASPALRRLASKYAMPARMWRHGIHRFLELLRHGLPESLEHMLAFIYLAYSTMALLYETVPAFEDTWIECLGDLGRYRMAIEYHDLKNREVWINVSRGWYSKASDKAPATGRLYHHLAILARPHALQQLFYYSKSLCVAIPFAPAKYSIMTLFDPVMNASATPQAKLAPAELALVRCHGIIFSRKMRERLEVSQAEFLGALDTIIDGYTHQWIELGYYVANAASCAIMGYGNEGNPIYRLLQQHPDASLEQQMETDDEETLDGYRQLSEALSLANGAHNVVFRRWSDPNILPYVYCTMLFIHHLTCSPAAMHLVGAAFPWKLLSILLNRLAAETGWQHSRSGRHVFPHLQGETEELPQPLPEDFALRGLPWLDRCFPATWFSNDKMDEEEKYFEAASMGELRKMRILHVGCRIADRGHGKWLSFEAEKCVFGTSAEFNGVDLEASSP